MKYFFLGASLTPLELEQPADIGFHQLMERLALNLRRGDRKKVVALRRYYDVLNLRLMWSKDPIDTRGNLAIDELEARVEMCDMLPEPVLVYLRNVEAEDRLRNFSQLICKYLAWESEKQSGFLRDYFKLERETRLILAGYRAKHAGIDMHKVLGHEDTTDPIIADLLSQKDTPTFTMPYGYQDLEEAIASSEEGPMAIYRAFAKFRFNRVSEMILCEMFTIDWLLGYTVLLTIAHELSALEQRNGEELLKAKVRY